MAEVLLVVIQMGLGIALPWWVVRRDMRRLPSKQLARTWNDASLWSALVAFGPLCVPVHFIKARRNAWGALLGVFWLVAVLAVTGAAVVLLSWVFGEAQSSSSASFSSSSCSPVSLFASGSERTAFRCVLCA